MLKESISSGMKGTIFSDDPRFADAMSTACGSYYRYVLQEEVINRPRSFDHFGKDGSVHHGEWFMRVTVHYAARRVADIAVTALAGQKGPRCTRLSPAWRDRRVTPFTLGLQ